MLISILTANYNSGTKLLTTWNSLKLQSDKNYKWLIKDNYSTDGSFELASALSIYDPARISVLQSKDSGIYDALNQLIYTCDTDYYLVLGAEDTLGPHSLSIITNDIASNPDAKIFFYALYVGNKTIYPMKYLDFLLGLRGCGSSHSVATVIKKDLHLKYGMYESSLSILADQLFIKTCLYHRVEAHRSCCIVGRFPLGGKSDSDRKEFRRQFYYVQVKTEKLVMFQKLLFFFRDIFRPV